MRRGRDVAVDIELSFEESIFGTERKVAINSKSVKQKEVKINVPPGIDDGQMIRLSGYGETLEGGIAGDLFVKVHVRKHAYLRKDGYNLVMDLKIKLSEALLGAERAIGTLDGEVTMKVPSGTKHGTILRVKGKGVPLGNRPYSAKATQGRGDLYVRISIDLPEKLSKEQKRVVEDLKTVGL